MNKSISIKESSIEKKVNVLNFMFDLTASERALICKLMEYTINNTIALTIELSEQIRGGMSGTSFNTGIFRLEKKRAIAKSGKTITLHPIFNNLDKLDQLVINFQSPTVFIEEANS